MPPPTTSRRRTSRPRSPRPIRRRTPGPSGAFGDVRVDQAYIGACVGAKLSDLRMAAEVLEGRTVAPGTRLLVAPASTQAMAEAAADGTLATLTAAGAYILPDGLRRLRGAGRRRARRERSVHLVHQPQLPRAHGRQLGAGLPGVALHGGRVGRRRPHRRPAGVPPVKVIEGRAWVFGDDVNTDVMAPGLYFKSPMAEMARHCLEAIDPAFAASVQARRHRRRRPQLRRGLRPGAGGDGADAPGRRRGAGRVLRPDLLSQRAQLRPAGAGVSRCRDRRCRRPCCGSIPSPGASRTRAPARCTRWAASRPTSWPWSRRAA